jgi:glutamate formiminotransferase / 5-formyltetrahydrofolate cyclo-ligase
MNPMKIIECVPNFSEGRHRDKVEEMVAALLTVPGISLLNACLDADHNRSVVTFIGTLDAVLAGALAICSKACEIIDMRLHKGEHPRIGAVDVVPFVPLAGAAMTDAVDIAHRFGRTFAAGNHIPVYFYGEAALEARRKNLADIRRGGYERLREKIKEAAWQPDAGGTSFNEQSGATAVGARMPLIAYNVNLKTSDRDIARAIAGAIRESGGGLPHVKALGIYLESRDLAQVSMNLTDFRITSPRKVFDLIREKARVLNTDVLESELIGLIPQDAFKDASPEYLMITGFTEDRILENHMPDDFGS